MEYKTKSIEIEAYQVGIDEMPEWMNEACRRGFIKHHGRWFEILINSDYLEDKFKEAHRGDYIIKYRHDAFWVCDPDSFDFWFEKRK